MALSTRTSWIESRRFNGSFAASLRGKAKSERRTIGIALHLPNPQSAIRNPQLKQTYALDPNLYPHSQGISRRSGNRLAQTPPPRRPHPKARRRTLHLSPSRPALPQKG